MENDYVTKRKPRTAMITSDDDITELYLSPTTFNIHSLGELSPLRKGGHDMQSTEQHIQSLEQENRNLQMEMTILQNECIQLRKKLSEKNLRIEKLENFNTQSVPNSPCSAVASGGIRRSLTFNINKLTHLRMRTSPINNTIYKNSEDKILHDSDIPNSKTIEAFSNTEGAARSIRNKIHIVSDGPARGLAPQLLNDFERHKDKCKRYEVFGMVKRFASSCELLKTCEQLHYTLKSNDVIILTIGSYDKNPYEFLFNLSNMLYSLRNYKVFLTNIRYNKYFNEQMINKHISLLIKNYPNCHLIDIYSENYVNDQIKFIKKLSFKILVELEFLHVAKNILNVSSHFQIPVVKKYNFSLSRDTSLTLNNNGNQNNYLPKPVNRIKLAPKRGTIPYYFQQQQSNNNTFFLS